MDIAPIPAPTSTAQPTPRHWGRLKILGGLLAVLLVLFLALLALNYFNILPLRAVPSTNLKPVVLSCPVAGDVCPNGLRVNYDGKAAVVWQLARGTVVGAAANVVDSLRFILPPYTNESPVGFYQSFISGSDCYTLTYTFPADTALGEIDLLPLGAGANLATASAALLDVDSRRASFILQMQKRAMDPKTAGKPDFERCSVTNMKTEDFGAYQNLSIDNFK